MPPQIDQIGPQKKILNHFTPFGLSLWPFAGWTLCSALNSARPASGHNNSVEELYFRDESWTSCCWETGKGGGHWTCWGIHKQAITVKQQQNKP